jgi:hypothetical protein
LNPILDDELDELDPLDELEQDFDRRAEQRDQTFRPLLDELEQQPDALEQPADLLQDQLQEEPLEIPDIPALPAEPEPEIQAASVQPEPALPTVDQSDDRLSTLVRQQIVQEYGGLRTRRGALREGTGVG